MKNKIIVLIILTSLFACDATPKIGDENEPFIVTKIDFLSNDMCEYFSTRKGAWDTNAFSGDPSVVLPCQIYNIGDTIIIGNKIKDKQNEIDEMFLQLEKKQRKNKY